MSLDDPRHGGSAEIYTKNRKIRGLSQTLTILSSALLSGGGPFHMSAEEQNNSLEKNLEFMQFLKLTIAQHTEKLQFLSNRYHIVKDQG